MTTIQASELDEIARREMAKLLYMAGSSDATAARAEWDYLQANTLQAESRVLARQYSMADALLKDGYRKPRAITEVKELDALPVGSVVLSDAGLPWLKDSFLDEADFPFWVTAGESRQHNAHRINLPAIVLHEPQP